MILVWLLYILAFEEYDMQNHLPEPHPYQLGMPYVGVCTPVQNDSLLAANGIMFLEESVANSFNPRNVSEEKFQQVLERIRGSKVKIRSANVFMPGVLKLVGPTMDETAILGYVDTVMKRAQLADVSIIVLGSGEARKIPMGYDSVTASRQFIDIARKMAVVAAKYQRVIAIENLNHTETNFVLSLKEAITIVKKVDHPSFRLTADIYHMLMENESADPILEARGLLVNVHIAEKEGRAYPGKAGTDFRPYFRAMKTIGYQGGIMLESRWTNFPEELPKAKKYLEEQIRSSYSQ